MVNQSLSGQVITENVWYLNTLYNEFFTKAVVALVILLVGFVIGRLLGRAVQKILHELEVDSSLKKAAGVKISLEAIIGTGVSFLIYFLAVIMALSRIGITSTVLGILSISLILLVIISVLLSIKDYVPNFLAGLRLIRKEMIKPGDYIRVKDVEGVIIRNDLIETMIETKDKDIIYIPNSLLIKHKMVKVAKESKQSSLKG